MASRSRGTSSGARWTTSSGLKATATASDWSTWTSRRRSARPSSAPRFSARQCVATLSHERRPPMRATGREGLTVLAIMTLTITQSGWALSQTPAQQPSGSEILEYKGSVAAAREAEVAPRLDGLLSKIGFVAGQTVKKGDVL